MSTHIFGEVGENRTLVNGFADHLLTTRTLPQIFDWILITFIDYMPPARNNAAHASVQYVLESSHITSHLHLGTFSVNQPTLRLLSNSGPAVNLAE